MENCQVWCFIIPALGRQRQKDLEFKAMWGYVVRPYLKNKQIKHKEGE
jgi:hypothetical protein